MKKAILLLSVISILFLAGCSLNENGENNNLSGDIDNQMQEVTDWVYDAEYERNITTNSYETFYGEIYNVEDIVVPFINIESADANKANNKIKQIFNSAIDSFNEGVNDRTTYVDECNYQEYINDDKLSVVLVYGVGATDVVHPEYYTYNFNLESGNEISYLEAYTYVGFDSTNIDENVKVAIRNKMQELFGEALTGDNFENYTNKSIENYIRSLQDDTIRYFIDEKGKLNVIVTLVAPVGRENFDTIIKVEFEQDDFDEYFNATWFDGRYVEENAEVLLTSLDSRKINFTYKVTSDEPYSRIADISIKNVILDDAGVGTFEFEDSWFNTGKGTIKLFSDQVIINITDMQISETVIWGIPEGEKVLKKVSTIEINEVEYEDINSIVDVPFKFNQEMTYAEPIKENDEMYVKLSDSFIIDDSKKEIIKFEILPSKIYSSDAESKYIFNYNNKSYYIPVEKCEEGKDRIVYRNYGIELLRENDAIKINDSVVNDIIAGWDLRESSNYDGELRYEDVSLCEAFLESWKITAEDIVNYDEKSLTDYIKSTSDYTHLYQVDFDDDAESLELIYTSRIMDHVHIDLTYPTYSIISYIKDTGAKMVSNDNKILWFKNILNYKNIFYGAGPFEVGEKVDNIISITENVITGYYIYDKNEGLVHIDRFANGEKFDATGFEKLSKEKLTLDGEYCVKTKTDGTKFINVMHDYELILNEENGEYEVNPNSEKIEEGITIYVDSISEDGYEIHFKTEKNEEYLLDWYY